MKNKLISLIITLSFFFNINVPITYAAVSKSVQNQKILEGNKLVGVGHSAYNNHNFLKAGESYEKAYQITGTKLYKENADVAYKAYVSDLLNTKSYEKALFYANKLFSANSNDKQVKELLSEIYFSRGQEYFYTGESTKAKSDIEMSIKYAIDAEQKNRGKDALEKLKQISDSNSQVTPKYQETSDGSFLEVLNAVEIKLYGKSNETQPVLDRIKKLEKESLGKNYENDSLIVRVDRLKRSIIPEYTVSQSQQQSFHLDNPNDANYVQSINEQSMGRVTVFGKMPITVYIEDADVKPYKKFYTDEVEEALHSWEKATDDKIKFKIINDPMKSDIKIVWTENFEDFPWKPVIKKEDLSAEKERMKYKKASTLVQMGSIAAMLAGGLLGVPVIGGVGAVGNQLASPLLMMKGTNNERLSPDVKINVKITKNLTDEQSKIKIKEITMHQIGHALGIYGHSSNPNDIMYENFAVDKLSERDKNTIKFIYADVEPAKK